MVVAGAGLWAGGGGEDWAADPQPTDASQIHSTEETVRKDRITDSLAPARAGKPPWQEAAPCDCPSLTYVGPNFSRAEL